ncbi:MAG: GIY-YIG nuclease family protein [bacterium]
MTYIVYILRTSKNTLYIGQTNNLEERIKTHKAKSPQSAKYLRYFPSFQLVYTEQYKTRTDAMRREAQLKRWTRAKKEALISGDKATLTIHASQPLDFVS